MSDAAENTKAVIRKNEKKWGKAAMEGGYTIIPTVLLKAQHALGLDPVDLNIILHLVSHWWDAERLPYLGKRKIAELMGVNESTVRRRLLALENAKLIRRQHRKDPTKGDLTNAIDFAPLIKKLAPLAEQHAKQVAERKAAHALRIKKKGIHLVEPSE